MIAALGTLALVAGLAAAIAWTVLWLVVALTDEGLRTARVVTGIALAAAVGACGALEWALVGHDFTIDYVAQNGGRAVPLYFTVTSLWSALDGSLLLWLLILAVVGVLLARGSGGDCPRHRAWAMVTTGVVAVFFFSLVYFAANPFEPAEVVPIDGPGPNPLLREHPAMGLHPPLLYAGYVALVVPFGYALAALLLGSDDDRWLVPARRWTLGAWSVLTVGITLGAWWSYAVLGWGGYWAWDPVENAALLPWLTATAALHVTMSRRRSGVAGWALGLFTTTFILVLVGTFLTRSGAVESVHSFTESPLGPMLLGFVVLTVAVVVGLLSMRGFHNRFADDPPRWWSRDAGFLYHAILLLGVAAVVLTGTIYPLISELLSGVRTSVGADYYNRATVPLLLAVLLLMGVAQLTARDGTGPRQLARRCVLPAAAGLVVIIAVGFVYRPNPMVLTAFGVAAFVLAGVATVWFSAPHRRSRPGLIAHAGAAIVAIGIAASSMAGSATLTQLRIGQDVTVAGVSARLTAIERHTDPDRMTVTARLTLERDGRSLGTVSPVLHYYPRRDTTVGAPAIRSRPAGDVYVTLTRADEGNSEASVRLAVNPLISLIWFGGAVIAAGGLVSLVSRRRAAHSPIGAQAADAPLVAGAPP